MDIYVVYNLKFYFKTLLIYFFSILLLFIALKRFKKHKIYPFTKHFLFLGYKKINISQSQTRSTLVQNTFLQQVLRSSGHAKPRQTYRSRNKMTCPMKEMKRWQLLKKKKNPKPK